MVPLMRQIKNDLPALAHRRHEATRSIIVKIVHRKSASKTILKYEIATSRFDDPNKICVAKIIMRQDQLRKTDMLLIRWTTFIRNVIYFKPQKNEGDYFISPLPSSCETVKVPECDVSWSFDRPSRPPDTVDRPKDRQEWPVIGLREQNSHRHSPHWAERIECYSAWCSSAWTDDLKVSWRRSSFFVSSWTFIVLTLVGKHNGCWCRGWKSAPRRWSLG